MTDKLTCTGGAHSRVHPLLSAATPKFLGITGAEISLVPETTKLSALVETVANVGKGTMMAIADARMVGAQVNGDGGIPTYAFLCAPKPDSWTLLSHPSDAKTTLKEHFAGCAGSLLNLIDYCDERGRGNS